MILLLFAIGIALSGLIFWIAKKLIWKLISIVLFLSVIGCGFIAYTNNIHNIYDLTNTFITQIKETITNDKPSNAITKTTDTKPVNGILRQLIKYTSESSAGPNNNYYWENGNAQLEDDSNLKVGELKFTKDQYGRSGIAMGKLTYDMFANSRGSRQGTPLNPPNWEDIQNRKVAITYTLTNRTYHGYFYNRSHSIADSLAGKQSYESEYNFTIGTRPQNVGADQNGGMRYAEEITENYWKSHPNSREIIQYQTTPLYNGTEILPRGSIVNIKSSDNVIDTQIVVINDAEGFNINYSTGSYIQK